MLSRKVCWISAWSGDAERLGYSLPRRAWERVCATVDKLHKKTDWCFALQNEKIYMLQYNSFKKPELTMNSIYFKNKIITFSMFLSALFFSVAMFTENSIAEQETDVLKIRWVIDEALSQNPELQSAKLRWSASTERIRQERALDDPVVGFTYFGEQVQTRVGEKQAGVMASQKVPFIGKRSLKEEVARNEAKVFGEKYRTLERELVSKAKSAFYELYWAHQSIIINEENRDLLQRFVKFAEAKYATSKATQQDVLKAQVELSKIVNELISLEQLKETAVARINTLLNLHPDTPLGAPEEVDIEELTVSLKDLYEKAKEVSPDLSILK